jgi:hypothetical protein
MHNVCRRNFELNFHPSPVALLAFALAAVSLSAQESAVPLRDFAMPGGNYYLRVPEFVEASNATFLKDDDRVIGVAGEGVAKAYPAAAVTWHHGVEDQIGKLPVFVTW